MNLTEIIAELEEICHPELIDPYWAESDSYLVFDRLESLIKRLKDHQKKVMDQCGKYLRDSNSI